MKALVCEMCGSNDLIKDGGVFVCQTCGCKYSVEEAKKMMVEGTVQVAGTVKVDNTEQVANYLTMARNAYSAKNNAEAEEYAKKVIEIDPKNYEAWSIKGKAAGWQSTGLNDRVGESISSWTNALSYVDEENKSTLVAEITGELTSLALASVSMRCNNFVSFRSEENMNEINNTVESVGEQIDTMFETAKIDLDRSLIDDLFAGLINKCAVNASNANDKEFGPERSDKSKLSWNYYTKRQDMCLELLKKAYNICNDDDICFTICKNYIAIAEETKDSVSYTYNGYYNSYVEDYSFTEEAKKNRKKNIDEYKKKKDIHDETKKKANAERLKGKLNQVRRQKQEVAAIEQYWAEHSDEKNRLELEKSQLETKIKSCEREKGNSSYALDSHTLTSQIAEKQREMGSLGIFKGKEKKALREEVSQMEEQRDRLDELAKDADKKLDEEIKNCESRINSIEIEFKRNRGTVSVDPVRTNVFTIFDEHGEFIITGRQLFDYLTKVFSGAYRTGNSKEKQIQNYTEQLMKLAYALAGLGSLLTGKKMMDNEYVDDPNKLKVYKIAAYEQGPSDDKESGVSVFFKAYNPEGKISTKLYIGSSNRDKEIEKMEIFVTLATPLIYGITKTATIDQIQDFLADSVYGLSKEIIFDDIKLSMKRKGEPQLTISKA